IGTERRRPVQSAPRLAYLASTALLLVVVALDPIVGFVGYVGGHAAEYLLVVRWRVARAAAGSGADAVGRVGRRVGGGGTLALYALAVAAIFLLLRSLPWSNVASVVILTLGGLHLYFDGLIWHAPRPGRTGGATRVVPGCEERAAARPCE